ncbi:MAG: hypothetical protein ACXIUQ_07390 [Cecembia sp.]
MNNQLFKNTSTRMLSIDLGTSSIGLAILGNEPSWFSNHFTKTPENRFSDPLLKNLETLRSIKKLKAGWNGPETGPFSDDLIQKVFTILHSLPFQPEVFPTGRNSIQLEFEQGDDYLEFEIFENKIFSLIQFDGKDEEREVSEEEVFKLTESFHVTTDHF